MTWERAFGWAINLVCVLLSAIVISYWLLP